MPVVTDNLFYDIKKLELNKILGSDVVSDLFKNENRKKVIVSILCSVDDLTTKLIDSLPEGKKRTEILQHRDKYKTDVLKATKNFLSNQDKRVFYTDLKAAENEFNESLKIDRYPNKRLAMRLLTNGLFTIGTCGIGLIVTSAVNKNKNLTWAYVYVRSITWP